MMIKDKNSVKMRPSPGQKPSLVVEEQSPALRTLYWANDLSPEKSTKMPVEELQIGPVDPAFQLPAREELFSPQSKIKHFGVKNGGREKGEIVLNEPYLLVRMNKKQLSFSMGHFTVELLLRDPHQGRTSYLLGSCLQHLQLQHLPGKSSNSHKPGCSTLSVRNHRRKQ